MFKGSDGIDSAPLALRDAISEFNSMAILFGVTVGMKVLTGVEQINKTMEHINETMKGASKYYIILMHSRNSVGSQKTRLSAYTAE